MHLGKKNEINTYSIEKIWLKSSTFKKDLGVLVDHNVNISQQCNTSAKKANILKSIKIYF